MCRLYRKKVIEATGSEDDLRVYYMERCLHGDISWLENNIVTNYLGAMRQALLDLSDWVERGIDPKPSSVYENVGNQIIVPPLATDRRGLQPTVQLTANGAVRATVKAGERIRFRAEVQVPAGAGEVTFVDYDFEEVREIPRRDAFSVIGSFTRAAPGRAVSEVEHIYEKPGTYFASVRVKSERCGDAADPFTQVRNLARARIIVE